MNGRVDSSVNAERVVEIGLNDSHVTSALAVLPYHSQLKTLSRVVRTQKQDVVTGERRDMYVHRPAQQ